MKVTNVETVKLVTVQLTQREMVVLRVALGFADANHEARIEANRNGVIDLHDDDFTVLYGQLGEALK